MNIMKYFFSLFLVFMLSCSSVEKTPLGEEGEECFANNTCKYGSNLYCVLGAKTNLCINKCLDYCHNDGECKVDKFNEISCTCKKGYKGKLCDKIDHCIGNFCVNGKCVNEDKDYSCQCEIGFMGKLCDKINPCEPNPCLHGSCTVVGDSYSCKCEEGFIDSGYGNCINKNCSLENTNGQCMENAHCYKENSSSVYCKCDDNFKQGPNNSCIPADCDKCNLCQRCVEGECVDNDSGYRCEGIFNHRCKPKKYKNDSTPSGCAEGFNCLPDPDEELNSSGYPKNKNALGYCTGGCLEPYTDSSCNKANYETRNSDRFMCFELTDKTKICRKLASSCEDNDFRQGDIGAKCDDSLSCSMNEYCKEGLLCIRGYCSAICDPENPNCGEHKECSANLWNNEEDPMHRCIYKDYQCKSDKECKLEFTGQENQVCNEVIRKSEGGNVHFDIFCGNKKGEKDLNEECPMRGGTFEENCMSDLCLGSSGSEIGTCGRFCENSKDCGENSFCFPHSIFSGTDAKVSICVDDNWFENLTYHGDCEQEGGCPTESNCSFMRIKEPVVSSSDLDYICLGPVDNNKKAIGESCSSPDECRTGFCINRNEPTNGASRLCSQICYLDSNCSSGTCTGLAKYSADSDVQYKYCK